MNKRQKEVQQAHLDNEKEVLKKLEETYKDSLADINEKIERLMARDDANLQNVIYQIDYQKALRAQVSAILETLHTNEFETISDYLAKSYEDGFIGTMYDLQGQGIPLVIPIDQAQIVAAIQHETKLSASLYEALGKDTKHLSKQIASEISRGISNAATYDEIARNIANYSNIPRNNAARIARTEAHRIQNRATAQAQFKAKAKGADVVKQWDSSLDGKTRETHRLLDGQIRELEEPFEANGKKAMQPGDFGDPAEDCNCRCCLLQRARWALDENELEEIKERAAFLGLDKSDNFDEYKQKYLKVNDDVDLMTKAELTARRKERTVARMAAKHNIRNDIDSLEDLNKYASETLGLKIDFSNCSLEYAKEQLNHYIKLSEEYNQHLQVVQLGTGTMFGKRAAAETFLSPDYDYAAITLSGKTAKTKGLDKLHSFTVVVDESKQNLSDLTHEFAHTISSSKSGVDEDFWREIKSIKNRYNRALTKIDKDNIVNKTISHQEADELKRKIFISKYGNQSVDEFMAESFTQAKLSDDASPYAKRVLDVVDKYFKKETLENIGKNSTMESDILIHRSVGAKSRNYDIKLPDGSGTHLTEGTRIEKVQVIAGKGRDREIDMVDILVDRYGGDESEWQKKKGFGYVDYEGESYRAELHWYEEKNAGRHEWKVKPDADGNWFYDED